MVEALLSARLQETGMTYRVLIVDDSKLARMALGKALNALRPTWERIEAANAADAVALATTEPFDLALLDFNMPGKDGLSLAAELREARPGIQLALISANHQAEVIERARQTGASFLAKPITEQSLEAFLRDSLATP